MKIFWSWQSDLPGKVGRFFVRDALEAAISALNQEREIEEPERPEAILDHDRKNVSGSPDLANIILEKIRNSEVFVADVTPVGQTDASPPKKLINPNVAIELGYALHTIGDRRLIMILNSAYGDRSSLPFDLRHKAGPIHYNLPPGASKEQVESVKRQLVSELRIELRRLVDAHSPQTAKFHRVAHIDGDPSRYFQPDHLVVNRESDGHFGRCRRLLVKRGPLAFLRVIPRKGTRQLAFKDAEEALNKSQVRPFAHEWHSMSVAINKWGAIAYERLADSNFVLSATQLHRTCEVWGFDSYLPDPVHKPKDGGPPGIWASNLEEAYQNNLPSYIKLLTDHLQISPPFTVIAGLSGIERHILAVPSNWGVLRLGPFLEDPIVVEFTLSSTDPDSIRSALMRIYEAFFEAVGGERPANFRNFPDT